jgi:hypothetical protein
MEGYLTKKSSTKNIFKNKWEKVYVALEDSKRLTSYRNETKSQKLKSYELQSNTKFVDENDHDQDVRFVFSLLSHQSSVPIVTFSAETSIQKGFWSAAITTSIETFRTNFDNLSNNKSFSDIKVLFQNTSSVKL